MMAQKYPAIAQYYLLRQDWKNVFSPSGGRSCRLLQLGVPKLANIGKKYNEDDFHPATASVSA